MSDARVNHDPAATQRQKAEWSDPDSSAFSPALRDRMTDDSRNGEDVLYKKDVGEFIEGGILLNSSTTQQRNPGGAPPFPLGPR